jgi:hypothetical protein
MLSAPPMKLEQLPPELRATVESMRDTRAPLPGTLALANPKTPEQAWRDYAIAVGGTWLLLLATAGFSVLAWWASGLVSAVIAGVVFGFCTLLSAWLWVGERRGMLKDHYFISVICGGGYVACKNDQTFWCVPLDGVEGFRLVESRVNGAIEYLGLELVGTGLHTVNLSMFSEEAVRAFAAQCNEWLRNR